MIFIWIEVCFEREPENTSRKRMSEEMLLYNHQRQQEEENGSWILCNK